MRPIDKSVSKLVELLSEENNKLSYAEISSKTGISKKLLKLLFKLGNNEIFIYESEHWSILDDISSVKIQKFVDKHEEIINSSLEDYNIVRNKKNASKNRFGISKLIRKEGMSSDSPIIHGDGEDYETRVGSVKSDGLTRGKVKLYKGPEGMYWTDPDLKKKEH